MLLMAATAIGTSYQCKPPAPKDTGFTFTIEADNSFTNLPALQSFSFGEHNGNWLMFGGRTNGFHGFNANQNFPYKMANKYIYAYNTTTHQLDSMSTDVLWADLRNQFTATNMACRQVDSFLYVCGGYGISQTQPDSSTLTHPIMSRIHVPNMIAAVQNHDSAALRKSVVYFVNELVATTGGELYKLADSNFYLCVGHNFTGAYSDTNAVQKYIDEVRVFKLVETDSSITMQLPLTAIINDGLPDSATQFHRRDLVVAPNVGQGGNSYGISIYGGVFTYSPGCPSCPSNTGGNPFRNPIYITGGANRGYTLDNSYRQMSNIYSAANLQMYDSVNDLMYTTIFGGIGDTSVPGGDSATFTQQVLTVKRTNATGATTGMYNTNNLPGYAGSEALFIRAQAAQLYNSNPHGIIDYNKLPAGATVVGYIYGGILSNGPESDPSANPTLASGTVYKVTINKN